VTVHCLRDGVPDLAAALGHLRCPPELRRWMTCPQYLFSEAAVLATHSIMRRFLRVQTHSVCRRNANQESFQ
jgi:hypothetical protein